MSFQIELMRRAARKHKTEHRSETDDKLACELHLPEAGKGMSGATPEARTAVMILVEATWEDQSGTVHSSPARMENRSTHGACIRLRSRIGVGMRLSIQSHREQFSGVARYYRPDGKDFLVGILKDEVHRPVLKKPPPEVVPKRSEVSAKERPAGKTRPEPRAERRTEPVPNRNAVRTETAVVERLAARETRRREAVIREEGLRAEPVTAAIATAAQSMQSFEGKSARKEWKFMKLKWFAGNEAELLDPNSNGNAASEPVQHATEPAPRPERRATPASAPKLADDAGVPGELLAMEDIYRAAGITSPRRGYSISKVVDMLRSEHMSGLSKEMRRAAVLMALDAAGVSVNEVLQDAKVRQEAVEAYAVEQRKHAEAQWARKAEENLQIQAELEQVKALYAERIRRNLDGVSREKTTFGNWLKLKEQETQGMAEAVEQVLKPPTASEPPTDPLLSVTPASVTGKPV